MGIRNDKQVEHNILAHNRTYEMYEELHGEIFNPIEQERLRKELQGAANNIKTGSQQKKALDYGCGAGNVTKYLLGLGFHTIASDVADKFLKVVEKRYASTKMLATLKIHGQDLAGIEDGYFDFVVTYSVLHHVPDYLAIVKEFMRVLKPGGVIYIDHERNEGYWHPDNHYIEYQRLARKEVLKKSWERYLRLSTYVNGIRRIINPRYQAEDDIHSWIDDHISWKRYFKLSSYVNVTRRIINPRYKAEGDIHVWPDDHIEWNKIEQLMTDNQCEIILKKEYLLYAKGYPVYLYEKYKDRCSDLCVLVARKTK